MGTWSFIKLFSSTFACLKFSIIKKNLIEWLFTIGFSIDGMSHDSSVISGNKFLNLKNARMQRTDSDIL